MRSCVDRARRSRRPSPRDPQGREDDPRADEPHPGGRASENRAPGRRSRSLRGRKGLGRLPDPCTKRLLANDPERVRLDPARGLVGTICRRARVLAGVPVDVPAGALRMTIDFSTEGRTWGGKVEVGIFRETAGIARSSHIMEGSPSATNYHIGARCGGRGTSSAPDRASDDHRLRRARRLVQDASDPVPLRRGPALHLRSALPRRHRARPDHSLDALRRLRPRPAAVPEPAPRGLGDLGAPLSSGSYLAGFYSQGGEHDYAGANFPSDATVAVERITIDPLRVEGDRLPGIGAGRFLLLARRGRRGGPPRARGQEARGDRGRLRRRAPHGRRWRAPAPPRGRRPGPAPGPRGRARRPRPLVEGGPVAFFRAIEDDGASSTPRPPRS